MGEQTEGETDTLRVCTVLQVAGAGQAAYASLTKFNFSSIP
jgi:hypothetical protein